MVSRSLVRLILRTTLASALFATPAEAATQLYAHDSGTQHIYAFDDTVSTLVNPGTPLWVHDMGLDEHGDLLLATATWGQYVARLDPDTEELTVIADTLGPNTVARRVCQYLGSGILVVTAAPEGGARQVDLRLTVLYDGTPPAVEIWDFSDSDDIAGLAVYPFGEHEGNILALSSDPGYLVELEVTGPASLVEVDRVDMPGNPTGLAVSPYGHVVVLEDTTGMYVVDVDDTMSLQPFGYAAGPGLTDVSIGSDGTIYVSDDSLGVVHRFDAVGSPVLPDLDGVLVGPGSLAAVGFTPTPEGEDVIIEPMQGVVVLFEEVTSAGYTTAVATASTLYVSPGGNHLPEFAVPPSPGSDEFTYITLTTQADYRSLIQVDVYLEGERLFYANGVGDTFRDFTITGSIDDARGTIPRFGEQVQPPSRDGLRGPDIVEVVLVDDTRTAGQVSTYKFTRLDEAMEVPKKQKLLTEIPFPEQRPEVWDDPGERSGLEPCPWGVIRVLRRRLVSAMGEYAAGHVQAAIDQLTQLNGAARYAAGWCIPDTSNAVAGNILAQILAHSKTLMYSIGLTDTGVDPGDRPETALALSILQSPSPGTCVFVLSGPEGADAALRVYSVSGRLVASVFEGRLEGGPTTIAWDGLDSRGRKAASGVYFARAEADGEDVRSKLVLLR